MKRIFVSSLIIMMLSTLFQGMGGGDRVMAADEPNGFDALRLKWQAMLIGSDDYDPNDVHIHARIADIDTAAQGYWETMEKSADRSYLWADIGNVANVSAEKTSTYTRLAAIVTAYATRGSALEGNPDLRGDIVGALDWLYQEAYNETMPQNGNWWDWQIGVPRQLLNIAVLMHDDLSEEQLGKYMAAVGQFATKKDLLRYTGANRVWLANVIGLMGVLTNNGGQVADARDALSEVFLYVTTGDGFYEDGSFIQHVTLPYNGGYGRALLIDVSKLVNWLTGSEWEVTDPNVANVVQWVYRAFEPLMHKGLMMDMTRGREISRYYSTDHTSGQGIVTAVMNAANFVPEQDAAAFRSMVKSWVQQNTYRNYYQYADIPSIIQAKAIVDDPTVPMREHPLVYRQFANMDRTVQVRPDYTFGLSMSSNRISTHEAVNLENMRGWYTAEGMTYLYNNDISQYTDDFWPTVNPYRLPGTTVDTQPRNSGALYRDPLREAGGVGLGEYGTSAMKVKAFSSSMVAKKSWFNFDDEIVALGAGITSSDGRTIETTIDNRKLAGAGEQTLAVNGVEKASATSWTEEMTGVQSIHLAGNVPGSDIGYYFPSGAKVNGLREMRTGAWSDIDHRATAPTDPITRPYMTLWYDHGVDPENETYQYVLLPNKTAADTSAYAETPDITILENSPEAQAVKENRLNITGIQFWNDAVKTVGGITSNKRAAVMARETEEELTLAISDPAQKKSETIELEIEKSATAIEALDPGITVTQLSPTIKLTVHMVESLGQSYHASFRLSPVTELPQTPTNFKAEIGQYGEVQLTWDIASQVSGYTVEYGTSSGSLTGSVDVGISTSYAPTDLELGQTYYFTVKAYNELGRSEASDEQEIMQTFIVVDNLSPQVTATGNWASSSATGTNMGYTGAYYAVDYWHDGNTGSSELKNVRYTPVLPSGTYKVSIWWLEHSNRSTVVPVEIHHKGGVDSATLNQRTPGSKWHELGTYAFAGGGSEYITISNEGANGYVVADAVKFERLNIPRPEIVSSTPGSETIELQWTPTDNATGYVVKYGTASGEYSQQIEIPDVTSHTLTELTNGTPYYVTVSARTTNGETPDADEFIVIPYYIKIMDDADSEGVAVNGDWANGAANATTYGSGFLHDRNNGKGEKSVVFTPDLPAGSYKVYARWVANSNRANNTPIIIDHAGESATVNVNQRVDGGVWKGLGRYDFNGDPSEKLTISNTGTNGFVVVDAVRFEQELPETPEVTEIAAGNGSATVHWTPVYNATGYVIKYGTVPGEYPESVQVSVNVSSHTLAGLLNGTTYYVTVSALRAANESPNGAEVEVTPQDTQPPTVPGNVTATAVSDSEVSLEWSSSTDDAGVSGYKVYRDDTEIADVTDTAYTDSGLSPATTYAYRIVAYDAAGNTSEPSTAVTATSLAEEEKPREEEPGSEPETPSSWPVTLPPQHTVNLSNGVATIKVNEVKLMQELQHAGGDIPPVMDLAALGGGDSDTQKLELSPHALKLLKEHGKGLELRDEGIRFLITPAVIATEGLNDPLIITVNRKEGDSPVFAGLSSRSDAYSLSLEAGGEPVSLDEPLQVALNAGGAREDQKLAVYAYDEATGEWTYIGGTYDADTNTITFEASHDAAYAVFGYNNPFADVARVPWAQEAIDELTMRSIMKGTGADTFAPGRSITRAEFVALMNRLLKLDEVRDSGQFADVETGAWYANDIATAFDAGIIQGDGERINPDSSITREEMAVMLMRAVAIIQTDDTGSAGEMTFADEDAISLWAKAAVGQATQLGLINGKASNIFDPKSAATRAEAAAVVYRMLLLNQLP
jgi:hyaluronate lyase